MKPTEVMYKVNICYSFLEQYLDFLIKQNLVERKICDGSRAKYTITPKGLDLLKSYGELGQVLQIGEENGTKECLNTLVLQAE